MVGVEEEQQQTLTNTYRQKGKAKGIRVAEWLVGHRVDVARLRLSLEGKGPACVFGDEGVEMKETGATMLVGALKEAGQA